MDKDLLATVPNVVFGLEIGTVTFLRSVDAPISGLSAKDVFVSFNNDCIDIIPYEKGFDYSTYTTTQRFKTMMEETWVDRIVDRGY